MDAAITALQNTPLPKILILAGLLFLLLGLVNKIGGVIEVAPEHKRWAFPIGLAVFVIGMVLNFSPVAGTSPTLLTSTSTANMSVGEKPVVTEGSKKVVLTEPPQGRFQLMNAYSGLCLMPVDAGTGRNVEVLQNACDKDSAHIWKFTEVDGSTGKIRNENSQLCLTVAGGNTVRNTPTVQYLCDEDSSRRWRYVHVDEGRFRLINTNSKLCLTVAGGSKERDLRGVQFPCDGDPSREWVFQRID